MGFWDREPDENAVREAMRRLKKQRDEEDEAKTAALAVGVLGCLVPFVHGWAAFLCAVFVGLSAGNWLGIGYAGVAFGLIPAVAWWRSAFRRLHPVLSIVALLAATAALSTLFDHLRTLRK